MREEAKNWWQQAGKDLESAVRIVEIDHHVSAFLSQQAVEKALKALLIQRTGRFPRIHDVAELSRMVKAPLRIRELCAKINPAYTATRYPDVASDFDKEEVGGLIESAEEVLEWIRRELKF